MGTRAKRKTRLEVLNREVHSIHFANRQFWGEAGAQSRGRGLEYHRRLERLEEYGRTAEALPGALAARAAFRLVTSRVSHRRFPSTE
jgi:hypothetical protein